MGRLVWKRKLTVLSLLPEEALEIIKTQTIERFYDDIKLQEIRQHQRCINITYIIEDTQFDRSQVDGIMDFIVFTLVIDEDGNIYDPELNQSVGTIEYVQTLLNLSYLEIK